MKTKRVVYSTITAGILQMITLAMGLIVPNLLLRTYGSAVNGLRASIVQIIGYIALVETGISGAITFELYKPVAECDHGSINAILVSADRGYKRVGVLFSVLLTVMLVVYPLMIEASLRSTAYGLIVLFAVPNILSYFISSKYLALLSADQLNYIVNLCRMVYIVLFNGIIVAVIVLGGSIINAYLFAIIASFVYNALVVLIVKTRYRFMDLKVAPNLNAMSMRYDVLTHQVSGIIVSGFPILMLTIYGSLTAVSIYSVYMIIFSGFSLLMGVFNNGFIAAFGALISENNLAKTQKRYNEYEYLYYVFMTVFFACAITLGLPFIKLYTQNIQDADYINLPLFVMFVVYSLLLSCKVPQTTIIQAAGQYRETKRYAINETVITVVSCVIFGYFWRLNGVLAGSILGVLYRFVDIRYAIRFLQLESRITVRRIFRMAVILGAFSGLLGQLPMRLIQSYSGWMACGLILFVMACIVTLAVNGICEAEQRALLLRWRRPGK